MIQNFTKRTQMNNDVPRETRHTQYAFSAPPGTISTYELQLSQ